jgi:hypothetical protein
MARQSVMADLAPSKAALLTLSALPVAAPYRMAAAENKTQTTAIDMLPPPRFVLIKVYGVSGASMSLKVRMEGESDIRANAEHENKNKNVLDKLKFFDILLKYVIINSTNLYTERIW